jgi:hypothetical protein
MAIIALITEAKVGRMGENVGTKKGTAMELPSKRRSETLG